MSAPSPELLVALDSAVLAREGRREGSEVRFRCPAHEDHDPSARWNRDKAVWHCDACGAGGGAVDLAKLLDVELPPVRARELHETVYVVGDAAGSTVAEHVRRDPPGRKKEFFWRRNGRAGLGGLHTSKLPLYGAERLDGFDRSRPLFVTEGEKAADRLLAIGAQAVGTVTGAAGAPSAETLEVLSGREVVLWPDADAPGKTHMERIAGLLDGIAASVRTFAPEGLPEAGDAVEWIESRRAQSESERAALLAELERLAGAAPLSRARCIEGAPGDERGDCWSAAIAAPEFLAASAGEVEFLEPRLLAPGCLTELFSPRGLGKTHVAHAIAVKLARTGRRVLLLDRDNSAHEVRRRLRGWRAERADTLKVLPRDKARPLTDAAAWRGFPSDQYDLVIVDSFDSTAEGVGEHDSEKPARALAPLLDIARRENGPAILVLGNTVRTGAHSRGSGVVEDRADIVYEVRDATGLQPTGTKPWIEELPPADAGAWQGRSTRRKQRDRYRLAFVPTKFRVGEEPEPFILEVNLSAGPWTLSDVTAEVDRVGAEVREAQERGEHDRRRTAVAALKEEVQARATGGKPLQKKDAEDLLTQHGLSRKAARELIETGSEWRLTPLAGRGNPVALLPVSATTLDHGGENQWASSSLDFSMTSEGSISDAQAGRARRESRPCNTLEGNDLVGPPISAAEDEDSDSWDEM